jgi:hypothetical protein
VREVLASARERVRQLGLAAALESPDEFIDTVIQLGRLLQRADTRGAVRAFLLEQFPVETDSRVQGALALVLSVYDGPPVQAVQSILRSSTKQTPSAGALLAALTLDPLPQGWGEARERRLWDEIAQGVPGIVPLYRDKALGELAKGRGEGTDGFTLDVSARTLPNEQLSKLQRHRMHEPSLLGVVFDYIARTEDSSLARDIYAWVDTRNPGAVDQLVASFRATSSESTRQALSRYFPSRLDPAQATVWITRESDPVIRRDLAMAVMSASPETRVSWFDVLIRAEPSSDVRVALITRLAEIKTSDAVDRLVRITEAGETTERAAALRELGNSHRSFAAPVKEACFLKAARDPEPEIRATALESLFRTQGAKHRELFERASRSDESEVVRSRAAKLLQ